MHVYKANNFNIIYQATITCFHARVQMLQQTMADIMTVLLVLVLLTSGLDAVAARSGQYAYLLACCCYCCCCCSSSSCCYKYCCCSVSLIVVILVAVKKRWNCLFLNVMGCWSIWYLPDCYEWSIM